MIKVKGHIIWDDESYVHAACVKHHLMSSQTPVRLDASALEPYC